MPINAHYKGPEDLPAVIPVFLLAGALLLPRGQMPLNIFEPRYLAMVEDALRSTHRLIGMIQPDPAHPGPDKDKPHLFHVGCVGRMTQFAESGDGRYLIQLTGVSRFRIEEELPVPTSYRQCRVTYQPFVGDSPRARARTRSTASRCCVRSRRSSRPIISRPTGKASRTRRTRP